MAMLHRLSRRVLRAASREVSASPSAPALVASPPWLAPWRVASLSTSARAGSRGTRESTAADEAECRKRQRRAARPLTASTSARGRPSGCWDEPHLGVASPIVRGASSPGRSLGRRGIRGRSRQRSVRERGLRDGMERHGDSWRTEGRGHRARQVQTSQRARHAPATRDRRRIPARQSAGATRSRTRPRPRARRAFFSRGRLVVRGKRRHASNRRARDGETRRSARRARGGGGCGGGGVLAQIRGTRLPGAPSRRVSRPRSRRLRLQSRGISRVRVLLHPSRPSERGESFDGDAGPGERGVVRALRGVGYRARNEPRRRDTQSFAPRVREALAPGRARLGGR